MLKRILRIVIALIAAILAATNLWPKQELECGLTVIDEIDRISEQVVRTACLKEFEARGYDRAKARWFDGNPHTDVSDEELAKWAPELEFKYNNVNSWPNPSVGYTLGIGLIVVALLYFFNAPLAPLAALGVFCAVFFAAFRLEIQLFRRFGEPIYLEGAIMPLLPLSEMQIPNLIVALPALIAVDFVFVLIRIVMRFMRKTA